MGSTFIRPGKCSFPQARETWLDSIVGAVPKDDPGSHLTKTMEVGGRGTAGLKTYVGDEGAPVRHSDPVPGHLQ